MRAKLFLRFVLLAISFVISSFMNVNAVNYDESKVPNYVLPDLLTCIDGTIVSSTEIWEEKRRPELLEYFFSQEYGYTPQGDVEVSYNVVAHNPSALDGLATAQQVMFTFSGQGKEVKALALVYIPNNRTETVPVFIGYNFQGNHNTTAEEWVLYSPYFEGLADREDPILGRGAQVGRWPVKTIVSRGYAVVTMCYHDIYPDNKNGESQSILALLPKTDDSGSRWQALGAWAWGSSRIADWVEKQSWANKEQLCVIGHSRQGKAAIWAGVQDERFKVVISNNSGCGGAALSKREYGETISSITSSFPHWFCENFSKYSDNEQRLPFDQHELLALVAPRHIYVASAEGDQWADPKGEYLSAFHASPVYELYGMKGLPSEEMPEVQSPIMNDIGYHIRSGSHDITSYDWGCYLDYCDKVYGRTPQHSYKDGVCEVCGNPDPEYIKPNSEGFYELGSAADLNWFAVKVNLVDNSINAVLTADIDNYTGAMIGTADVKYAGTFDGQFHTINYATQPTEPIWGLFRTLSGTVKNLRVTGTITTDQKQCGGLAGFIYGATIQNCISSVDIITSFSGDAGTGGIVATTAEVDGSVIKNCLFDGTIQGANANSCAGIIGWTPRKTYLNNCLVIGEISVSEKNGDVIARNQGNAILDNCYYLKAYGSIPGNITKITEEQLQSGEICYKLNGQQEEIVWTQTLGEDSNPIPVSTGDKVYASPSDGFHCDGTPLGEISYTNTAIEPTIPDHEYEDGLCKNCDNIDPNFLSQNSEGVYEISTKEELAWFAKKVNQGDNKINAVLTADIDNYTGVMIGTTDVKYAGVFDGNFHKITYFTEPTEPIWGLFRTLSGTVKNLRVTGTITTDQKQCGGLAGFIYGATIQNCISSVDIITSFSGDAGTGGIVATTTEIEGSVIKDCIFDGTIQGANAHSCAGIVGWTSKRASLTNCLVIGEISVNENNGDVIARNQGNAILDNCYYLNAFSAIPDKITKITEEQLQSGEVCYKLNGQQEELVWTQTLGTDRNPVPFSNGDKVYASPSDGFRCDGTPLGEITYTNTIVEFTIPDHEYEDGKCIHCGEFEPDLVPLNPDGFYEISSEKGLEWFATKVNQGETDINAVLTADITDYTGPVIGTGEIKYAGVFDGQYHTINYTTEPTEPRWGLFRTLSGTVKNLHVSGTMTTSFEQCGGIVGFIYGATIQNCISTVDIITSKSGDAGTGGIVATNMETGSVLENCIFAGTIRGADAHSCAGIVGWTAAAGFTTLNNCLVIGEISTKEKNGDVIARNPSKVTRNNCYYLKPYGSIPSDVTQITEAQLQSGEAGFLMNKKNYETPAWFQRIGEDLYPVPNPERGIIYAIKNIYGNAFDDASFQTFKDAVLNAEEEYIQNVVAQIQLVEEYENAVNEKLEVNTIEEFMNAWKEIEPLYNGLVESEKSYADFRTKVEEISSELENNENLQNAWRDRLEYYLNNYEAPNETYANGTAVYILEERLLNVAEINAEIIMVEDMYNKALTSAPGVGADVTKLMVNPDFSDGFNGWEGEKATGYGISPTTSMRAAECYNGTMDMHQTITGLQNGIYEFQINGAFRPYPGDDRFNTNYAAVLYANGVQNYFMTTIEDVIAAEEAEDGVNSNLTGEYPDYVVEENGNIIGYVPQGIIGHANAFSANRYFNSILCEVVDGTLTLGIRQPGTGNQPECLGFGNIKLIYHGSVEDASEGLNRVLASQCARANTLVNTYKYSSASDYASYPNFSAELKEQLTQAMNEMESITDAKEKYALVLKFSELFQQVYECKKAYVNLMAQSEDLAEMLFVMEELLNDEQKAEINTMMDKLIVMYEEATTSVEDAKKNYIRDLSFALQIENNVCEINSALDLAMFAFEVNNGNNSIDAVLKTDIENYTGPVIATSTLYYAGTFDGQYHTINYTSTPTEPRWGLFRTLSGTIKNLHVSGTLNTNVNQCGGLVGFIYSAVVQNCISSVDIITTYSGDAGTGGLVATNMENSLIKDCVFSGTIQGAEAYSCAGLVGWTAAAGSTTLTNCLVVGDISTKEKDGNVIARNPSKVTRNNCYYLKPYSSIPNDITQVTEEALASGEVCYLLNGDQSNIQWTQLLGEDNMPKPFPGAKVGLNENGVYYNLEDAIESIDAEEIKTNEIFNLMGQKVAKVGKGIYIVNGKKVLFK